MMAQAVNALQVLQSWIHLGPLFILIVIGALYAASE